MLAILTAPRGLALSQMAASPRLKAQPGRTWENVHIRDSVCYRENTWQGSSSECSIGHRHIPDGVSDYFRELQEGLL